MMFKNRSDARFRAGGWKKSRRSDGNNACVMVQATPDLVGVCDGKTGADGPVLTFTPDRWSAFARAVSRSQLTT